MLGWSAGTGRCGRPGPHLDWAARATTSALPEVRRFDGVAVPLPIGSLADIVVVASRPTNAGEVDDAFRVEATTNLYRGLIGVSDDPLMSAEIVGEARRSRGSGTNSGRGRQSDQDLGMIRQPLRLSASDDSRGLGRVLAGPVQPAAVSSL